MLLYFTVEFDRFTIHTEYFFTSRLSSNTFHLTKSAGLVMSRLCMRLADLTKSAGLFDGVTASDRLSVHKECGSF